jgi:site-specific DNA-methyltransferase (adenine-specific)
MKRINGGTQMKDVWSLPAISPWEKSCGKHPTQKPLALLTRIILASTRKNEWILDPFTGSSTTGIAANLTKRNFLGIDKEEEFLSLSRNRRMEIENPQIFGSYRKKLVGFLDNTQLEMLLLEEPENSYARVPDFW